MGVRVAVAIVSTYPQVYPVASTVEVAAVNSYPWKIAVSSVIGFASPVTATLVH
jgi:hypothetical protein